MSRTAALTVGLAFLVMGAILIAVAQVETPQNAPTQIHATHMGDRIGILWARPYDASTLPTTPIDTRDVVRFGVDAEPTETVEPVEVRVLAPGVVMHTAHVPVPEDGQTIRYQVGSHSRGWSEIHVITVRPGPDGVWRFAAYGDHGAPSEQDDEAQGRLLGFLEQERPMVALHTGDVSYANGNPAVWDEYFEHMEPVAASTPLVVAAGNHEHEGDWLVTGPAPEYTDLVRPPVHPYQMFIERLEFPSPELHYSVDIGPVHVLVFNTEDICSEPEPDEGDPWSRSPTCQEEDANQTLLDWITADLAANALAAWTFVVMHRPAFSSGAHEGLEVLQERFVPIFEDHGVDLVLAGHDHNYQRSFPLRQGEPTTRSTTGYAKGEAPIHVVTGGAGRTLYEFPDDRPDWTAARDPEFHVIRIDVTEAGLSAETVSLVDGDVIDSFTIGDEPQRTSPPAAYEPPSAPAGMGGAVLSIVAVGFALASARRP